MAAISPTRGTSIPKKITMTATIPIPANGAGMILVTRGITQMIAIVKPTKPSIVINSIPPSHSPPVVPWPETSTEPGTLNCVSCARKITMAKPLTKPNITGCGTRRINLPHCITPAKICSSPIKTTVAKRYSTPCSATKATITTAKAPVAPEIIPGRPPKIAVIRPTRNAA